MNGLMPSLSDVGFDFFIVFSLLEVYSSSHCDSIYLVFSEKKHLNFSDVGCVPQLVDCLLPITGPGLH